MENENNAFETVDRALMEQNFNKLKEIQLPLPLFKKTEQLNNDYFEIIANKFKQLKEK
jgi:hypothetical protein